MKIDISFSLNTVEQDLLLQQIRCGKPLVEEVYYDCDFDKYCSFDCIIHACGFERIQEKK